MTFLSFIGGVIVGFCLGVYVMARSIQRIRSNLTGGQSGGR
jgi:F0F1-type ATP synthase assembly protein I